MQRLFPLLALWLCFSACAPEAPSATIDTAPFFDLSGYFNQEVERLEAANTKVEKIDHPQWRYRNEAAQRHQLQKTTY